MTFGLTPTGFNPKLLQDVLQELSDDQKGSIDPNWDTSSDSPQGQVNGTFARQVALGWEAVQSAHDGLDSDKAEDAQLINLCKLSGTTPRAAAPTVVVCSCDLDVGTTLLAGVHFANVAGLPSVRATPIANYTAGSSGLQNVTFQAEVVGPTSILAGTLTIVNTPVVGWNSVTNALDGVTGRNADTNETLRPRRVAELTKGGLTSQKALRAKLLALEVNGAKPVLSATVYVNETDVTDANGLLPHSIECVLFDSPAVSNTLLAQTIWDGKAPGVPARGQISANATDSDGDLHAIGFSRVAQVNVYLTYTIKIGASYVGDAAFKAAVVSQLQAYTDVGAAVLAWDAQGAAKQSGVLNLTSVTLGTAPAPTSTQDLVIGSRQIAAFDTSRIVVIHA